MTDELCMHPVVVAVQHGIGNGETATVWMCKNTDCKKEFQPVPDDLLRSLLSDIDLSTLTLPTPEEMQEVLTEILPNLTKVMQERKEEIQALEVPDEEGVQDGPA